MVRNIRADEIERMDVPVLAIGNDYAHGHAIPPHHHWRGQLLFGTSGVVVVSTPTGTWVMPPQRGMWIPPGTQHHVRMLGAVSVESILLAPDLAADMPGHCQVVAITPFMRSLIGKALDLPLAYEADSHAGALMALIQHEMRQLPVLPLSLPLPVHAALARRCRQFLLEPKVHEAIEDWAASLAMSRRSFTRLFRRETGMSFLNWRQQACLVTALPRLVAGEAVTSVALDLGYDNPAAFTSMFKRVLGASPRVYLRDAYLKDNAP
ncbi:MAG TPA: helix-turn-helix transcriptional regulator [Stellaceae bacterium]|jgi:AraC-like DNA-binding protein|nr:helix-turn-helix transcriptional regulator [Stellaceae bacterium]